VTKLTTSGSTSAKPEFFFLERYMRAYEAEWSAFVASMENGVALPVTLKDGINALAVAEAATLSYKTGLPVELKDGKPVSV
jgi:myo-inositol 2-dehydrogenase/D-chiro-inositol 1-dehydrogenase